MRLFYVDGEFERRPKLMRVTRGEEGPAVYLRDHVLHLGEGLKRPFAQLPLQELWLLAAKVVPGKPLLPAGRDELEAIHQRRYTGPCAVHVCMPTEAGRVRLLSSQFVEELEGGRPRVVRSYLQATDSPGVEKLAMSEDREEAVLQLLPGASFRVETETSAPLVVHWSGCKLWVHKPTKYQQQVKTRTAA